MPTELPERRERKATGRTPNYAVVEKREIDIEDYRDTPKFKAYRLAVEHVLRKVGKAVTIAELKKILADNWNERWTMDALHSIDCVIHIPKYPCDLFIYDANIRRLEGMTVEEGNALPFLGNKRMRRWNGVSV